MFRGTEENLEVVYLVIWWSVGLDIRQHQAGILTG
jgi:hypothetical protein